MDKTVKVILICYCLAITTMATIVPFSYTQRGVRYEREYTFILSTPDEKSIDYGLIVLELIAATGITALAYLTRELWAGQSGKLKAALSKSRDYWTTERIAPFGTSLAFRCTRLRYVVFSSVILLLLYGWIASGGLPKEGMLGLIALAVVVVLIFIDLL